jgi:hypothetical protein
MPQKGIRTESGKKLRKHDRNRAIQLFGNQVANSGIVLA